MSRFFLTHFWCARGAYHVDTLEARSRTKWYLKSAEDTPGSRADPQGQYYQKYGKPCGYIPEWQQKYSISVLQHLSKHLDKGVLEVSTRFLYKKNMSFDQWCCNFIHRILLGTHAFGFQAAKNISYLLVIAQLEPIHLKSSRTKSTSMFISCIRKLFLILNILSYCHTYDTTQ